MTIDDAKAAITAAGLTVGPVTTENSSSIAANIVIKTDPGPAAKAHAGDTISFTVSSGNVTLTDLTGQSISAATGILSELGLTANPKPDKSCPADDGSPLVHAQSVAPGDVPQGSSVDLTYCTG